MLPSLPKGMGAWVESEVDVITRWRTYVPNLGTTGRRWEHNILWGIEDQDVSCREAQAGWREKRPLHHSLCLVRLLAVSSLPHAGKMSSSHVRTTCHWKAHLPQHLAPCKQIKWMYPHYGSGSWGSERLNELPKTPRLAVAAQQWEYIPSIPQLCLF